MVEIPEDIIRREVLSRLPSKSLLRFKCVSKQWFSTISHDSQFHRLHLNRNRHNPKLIIGDSRNILHSMDRETLFEEEEENYGRDFIVIQNMEYPSVFKYSRLWGSCDGLILLAEGESFILWNPSIKSYRKIPIPFYIIHPLFYGFCYDSSLDDYKVVIFFLGKQIQYKDGVCYGHCYAVFSLRSGRWTEFKNIPYDNYKAPHHNYPDPQKGVIVNEALHWVVALDDPFPSSPFTFGEVIVSYDLVKDEFKEVPILDKQSDPYLKSFSLANLRGCLCICGPSYQNSGQLGLKVWETKEYGVKESWTPLFIVDLSSKLFMHPLCFNKNGEVVMLSDAFASLSVYDTKRKRLRFLKHSNTKSSEVFVDTYIESLISP